MAELTGLVKNNDKAPPFKKLYSLQNRWCGAWSSIPEPTESDQALHMKACLIFVKWDCAIERAAQDKEEKLQYAESL